ncbi:MAG: alcohol dehydrogenase catalytic domain-containing protein [Planctomycetota bacterium]
MKGIEVYETGKFRFRDDLPTPVPGPGEVRIRVAAAGICGTDVHILKGDPGLDAMMRYPVVLGHEFCGHVDALGPGVEGPAVGTYVSAEMHEWCGHCPACKNGEFHACQFTEIHGLTKDGCFAEYIVLPAANVVALPDDLPVKGGAILDPLGNAVHTALKAPVDGANVLVVGYGPIGAMAAEVLAFEGARRVWITDVNPKALTRARHWVAHRDLGDRFVVLDVSGDHREPALRRVLEESRGGPDVALEFSGHPNGINDALRLVRAAGTVALLGLPKDSDVVVRDFGRNVVFAA